MSRRTRYNASKLANLKAATLKTRSTRDCSKLTIEQLVFLAAVPGNSDVIAELEKRQTR